MPKLDLAPPLWGASIHGKIQPEVFQTLISQVKSQIMLAKFQIVWSPGSWWCLTINVANVQIEVTSIFRLHLENPQSWGFPEPITAKMMIANTFKRNDTFEQKQHVWVSMEFEETVMSPNKSLEGDLQWDFFSVANP